jgi:hypothetical protein
MDLFVIIFQIPRPNCKIMDCGLISKKPRGLNEKCQKLEFSGNCFPKGKPWTESTSPWTASGTGPRSSSRKRLAGERLERRPRARNLTAVEGKGRGDSGEPHQLQEGRRSIGHDWATVGNNRRRRCSVGWMLRTRKRAIEGGVSVVMGRGCSSPFYSGRGGAHQGEGGGNGQR